MTLPKRALIFGLGACMSMRAVTFGDPGFDAYLRSLGLENLALERSVLLAVENGFTELPADERARMLAALTKRLQSASGTDYEHWASLAQRAVRDAPSTESLQLRVALARAELASLSSTAERSMIGVDSTSPDAIRREASTLASDLGRLIRELDARVAALESRRSGRDPFGQAETAFEQARNDRVDLAYRAMWANLYAAIFVGEFGNDRQAAAPHASQALAWAEWVLRGGPSSDGISVETIEQASLGAEQVAWAAVVASYAEVIIRSGGSSGFAWLDSIEDDNARAPAVAAQLPRYRVGMLAYAGRWAEASRLLERLSDAEADEVRGGVAVARRLLISASAASRSTGTLPFDADQAAEAAFAFLLSSGATADALELAADVPIASGEAGFVASCLQGMRRYGNARDTHRVSIGDPALPLYATPPADPRILALYQDAISSMTKALESSDTDQFQDAASIVRYYRGVARATLLHSASNPDERLARESIADLFTAAEALETISRTDAADALYIAVKVSSLADLAELKAQAFSSFRALEPNSPRALSLQFEATLAQESDSESKLSMLLSVLESSPDYTTARRRAAEIAFSLFRESEIQSKPGHAERYVDIAQPLFETDEAAAESGDGEAAGVAAGRGLRLVETLRSLDPPQLDRARGVASRVQDLITQHNLSPEVRHQAAWQLGLVELASGDTGRAIERLSALADANTQYREPADRVILDALSQQWSRIETRFDPSRAAHTGVADLILQTSARLLDPGVQPSDQSAAFIRLLAGRVLFALSQQPGSTQADARRAIAMLEPLTQSGLRNRDALERLAVLYAQLGMDEQALECYRILLGGVRPGSDDWFRLKVGQIRTLAMVDEVRSRDVFEQVRVLYPELGPEPWRTQLLELDRQIIQREPAR